MTHIVEQMADLAGMRDPEGLDDCFVELFTDLLNPQQVHVLRARGNGEALHWRPRVPRHTHPCREAGLPSLEPAADAPSCDRCASSGRIEVLHGSPSVTLVPMASLDNVDTPPLIELVTPEPLTAPQLRTVAAVQRFCLQLRALLDENERDSLTRLLNRKSFDETFVRTAMRLADAPLEAAADERRPAEAVRSWLGVVDIDHFKRVNDTHGHLIGDEVLILLARLMKDCFRADDKLYRFGGEEFVVLIRCHAQSDAGVAFGRLRSTVEAFDFPQAGRLTVSIGYTEVVATDTPSDAFERADQAVYYAKQHGRNLAANYEQLVEDGHLQAKDAIGEIEFF